MREHPVRIQPEMVMAVPPGRGHRACPVNHERIKTSPADRPRSRQAGRASADDHDTLIHDASLSPSPAAVNKTHPATQSGPGVRPKGGRLTQLRVKTGTPADVRTLLERMEADGITIIEREDEAAYTAFKCLDPDGHRIEVYWEPPLAPAAPLSVNRNPRIRT
jgi:catechol 2,3-dioxygenase-like lactoylglutathione lyase family enzyme